MSQSTCSTFRGSTLFVKVKLMFKQKYNIFFENYNETPLDMHIDYPKLPVSDQREDSIYKQRGKPFWVYFLYLDLYVLGDDALIS